MPTGDRRLPPSRAKEEGGNRSGACFRPPGMASALRGACPGSAAFGRDARGGPWNLRGILRHRPWARSPGLDRGHDQGRGDRPGRPPGGAREARPAVGVAVRHFPSGPRWRRGRHRRGTGRDGRCQRHLAGAQHLGLEADLVVPDAGRGGPVRQYRHDGGRGPHHAWEHGQPGPRTPVGLVPHRNDRPVELEEHRRRPRPRHRRRGAGLHYRPTARRDGSGGHRPAVIRRSHALPGHHHIGQPEDGSRRHRAGLRRPQGHRRQGNDRPLALRLVGAPDPDRYRRFEGRLPPHGRSLPPVRAVHAKHRGHRRGVRPGRLTRLDRDDRRRRRPRLLRDQPRQGLRRAGLRLQVRQDNVDLDTGHSHQLGGLGHR